MLEEEILTLLVQAKEKHKTLKATADALGVPFTTFHSWIKLGKGIKDQPLFKVLDALGVHLTNAQEIQTNPGEGREVAISCISSMTTSESLNLEVVKAKAEGLENQLKMALAHNEALQEQIKSMNSIILDLINKKDCSHPVPSSIDKVS